jgi:Tfp pilus assembly protein PilF/4-amino-4-deoxy-L-arabinose transferase-like glycosyltransferase
MLGALVGGAALVKAVVLFQLRAHQLLQPNAGLDTSAYVDLAQRVVAGDFALGPGLYFVSPLYIYFLAATLALFDSFTAVRVVQILLGTASVAFIFLTARIWFGDRAALAAGILATLTGLFTFYEVLILQASIDAFLTSAALLALAQGTRDDPLARRSLGEGGPGWGRPAWCAIAGVVFGLQTLNRPNVMIAAIVVGAVLLAMRQVRLAAALAAGMLVGMSPVAVRNLAVAGQFSLVSSHGGLNFYIGNNAQATGFYHPVSGITPTIVGQEKDAKALAERREGRSMTDSEVSSYFVREAVIWTREHPGNAALLFLHKVRFTFHAQHVALPHSYPFYAQESGTLLRLLVVGPWLLVPLGIVGLIFAAPRSPGYLAWVAFVPGYAVAVAIFFVAERYRLPLLVPLCAGAGAAVAWFVEQSHAGLRSRPAAAAVASLVALTLFVNWPTALQDGRWEEGLRLAERLVIDKRFDEAESWTRWAETREPRPGATMHAVGLQLLQSGEPSRAVPYLEKALATGPSSAGAVRYDLAVARQTSGDNQGAAAAIAQIRPADTESHESWLKLGRLAAQAQAPDIAEPFFRRAAEMQPESAAVRQQHGLNLMVLRRYEDAARELAAAANLDGRDPDTLSRLAFCELKLGRLGDARTHAEAALRLNPGDALARQLATQLGRR